MRYLEGNWKASGSAFSSLIEEKSNHSDFNSESSMQHLQNEYRLNVRTEIMTIDKGHCRDLRN